MHILLMLAKRYAGTFDTHHALQYIDALRLGDTARFEHIERVDGAWWSVDMDRGAGAALHFAAEHGQARGAPQGPAATFYICTAARSSTPVLGAKRVRSLMTTIRSVPAEYWRTLPKRSAEASAGRRSWRACAFWSSGAAPP